MKLYLSLFAVIALFSTPLEVTGSPDLRLYTVEENIVYYTNLQRKQYGLAPLTIDHSLIGSARRQAQWMASSGLLAHTSLPVAENIAMGQQNSREAVRDWMNSPGHRANMLNASYKHIGAAAYVTSGGTIYWCVQFTSG